MKLDDFTIVEKLGTGNSSEVYLAEGPDGRVALKVLHEHLADDVLVRQRFVQEGKILAGIRHPNIVRIISVEQFRQRPAFVMEYVEGGTAEKRTMDGPEVTALIEDIASALAEIHRRGIVHRAQKDVRRPGDSRPVPTKAPPTRRGVQPTDPPAYW